MASDNEKTRIESNDEIDLRQLFAGIGNFFQNIFTNLIWLIVRTKNTTWKYRKLFLIIAVPIGLLSLTFRYTAKDYYQSSIIIKNNHINNSLMFNAINKLNVLCEERNYVELARVLKISEAIAEQIKSFDYAPLVTEADLIGTEEMKAAFLDATEEDLDRIERMIQRLMRQNQTTYRIFVYIYDYNLVTKLEEPLVNYFKGTNYVKRRLEIDRENLELRQAKIDENLKELDSLKFLVVRYFGSLSDRTREGSNNVILAEERTANPITIFGEHEKMYAKKLEVRKQLYLDNNFEVIDGFTAFKDPINPGYVKTGFYAGLITVGLFYFIIILMEINVYLNNFEKRHKEQEITVG